MDFSPYFAIVIGLALFSIGLMLGYVLALHLQRRSSGGKLASELKAELQEYREQVTEHFSATSDLFQTLTEQYRALYDHLSHGARDLCSPDPGTLRLDLPDRGLLARDDAGEEGSPEQAVSRGEEEADGTEAEPAASVHPDPSKDAS
jgi:uncharacterized membrane-anchored protein YhcB (DUF1043 family)